MESCKVSLNNRILDRLVLAGGLERLGDNAEELEALYEDVLIGVIGFFRDPDAWAQNYRH